MKNLRIKFKILILAASMILFMIAIGGVGIKYLKNGNNDMSDLYHSRLLAIQYLNDNRNQGRAIEGDLYNILLHIDNRDSILKGSKDIEDRKKIFLDNMQKYKGTDLDKEELDIMPNLNKDLEAYLKGIDEAIQLALNGNKNETINKLNSLETSKNSFQKSLKELAVYNTETAEKLDDKNDKEFENSLKIFMTILVIAIIIAIVLSIIVTRSIVNPLERAVKRLKLYATGDLSTRVSSKYTTRKDEIGEIANALNNLQQSLSTLLENIILEADEIKNIVDKTSDNVISLNSDIEEVSATTEELSAGMEETAAASEEMSATSHEIGKAVSSISNKAEEGAISANEIDNRAITTKEGVVIARNKASKILEKTKDSLQEAIEEAKVVEKINVLSESIMAITSQTNLLALNAAIEAARAGEVGRGFTVVAEEIRKLAEESKETVIEINHVTESVVSSVKALSESSMELLKFVSEDVDSDYDKMIAVADKYKEDSDFVNNLVSNFNDTSEELSAAINDILRTIDAVAGAANDGASGTLTIANKVSDVTQKSEVIKNEITKSEETAKRLKEHVSKFKIQ